MTVAKEFREGLGLSLTWPPEMRVEVGDILSMSEGRIHRLGNIRNYGSELQVQANSSPGSRRFSSEKGVSARFKAAGEAPFSYCELVEAHAGVFLELQRNDAVFLHYDSGQFLEIKGGSASSLALMLKFANEDRGKMPHESRFPLGSVLVTQVVCANAATLVVSAGEKGCVSIDLGASFQTLGPNLEGLSVEGSIVSQHDIGYASIDKQPCTPLFSGFQLFANWYGKTDLHQLGDGPGGAVQAPDDKFLPTDYYGETYEQKPDIFL